MYPGIQQELNEGKLLLEWDQSKGKAPAPLLKVNTIINNMLIGTVRK